MVTARVMDELEEAGAAPPIRTSVEAATRDLDDLGFTLFRGAITDDELGEARLRLDEQAAGERARGLASYDGGQERLLGGPNQRVYNLINKGEIFRTLTMKPVVHELFRHMLGRDFIVSSLSANIVQSGGRPMALHTDQMFAPPEIPLALVANCLWMLDDFTEENGATRIVPGSHKFQRRPPAGEIVRTEPAAAPAGTILVFDGRLWHGTGASRSDTPRRGILSYVCRPFIRQQETATISIAPDVADKCSPALRVILGLTAWNSLGGYNSSRKLDTTIERPAEFVKELR